MDTLVLALGRALAAGFAVQRLLEILDPFFEKWFKEHKGILMGVLSLGAGILLAWFAGVCVLQPLGITTNPTIDMIVAGFVISAGTEGLNSILKFLGYTKEQKKAEVKEQKEKEKEAAAARQAEAARTIAVDGSVRETQPALR